MRVYLTRHGSTQGNLEKRYIGGDTDEGLCGQGVAGLKTRPVYDGVACVYTSSMLRTAQTASILYPHARQVPVPGLREMRFGRFEGGCWDELQYDEGYRAWVEGGCVTAPPGGESRECFTARCQEAFLAVLQNTSSEEVHFVVHGGTIMALFSVFAQPERAYFDTHTQPGESWVCGWDGSVLRIVEEPENR